jgi:hypothetical protein
MAWFFFFPDEVAMKIMTMITISTRTMATMTMIPVVLVKKDVPPAPPPEEFPQLWEIVIPFPIEDWTLVTSTDACTQIVPTLQVPVLERCILAVDWQRESQAIGMDVFAELLRAIRGY